jgi:hypothetical protein
MKESEVHSPRMKSHSTESPVLKTAARQRYHTESLHVPRHPVTAAGLTDSNKEPSCIIKILKPHSNTARTKLNLGKWLLSRLSRR